MISKDYPQNPVRKLNAHKTFRRGSIIHLACPQHFPKNVDFLPTHTHTYASVLKILTGKKHPKVKLQRLQKIQIWSFELKSFKRL